MCGRFVVASSGAEIADLFDVTDETGGWAPTFSIAPTDSAPIILPDRRLIRGIWDVPQPANTPRRGPIINARIEKLPGAFWSGYYSNYRCAVPMSGYYEWTAAGKLKMPHFIHGPHMQLAAGVYSPGPQPRFAIVTREARDASGELHERMPAFLGDDPDFWEEWLDPASLTVEKNSGASRANREELRAQLEAVSEAAAMTITHHDVDRKVNSVRAIDPSDPTLIAPVTA